MKSSYEIKRAFDEGYNIGMVVERHRHTPSSPRLEIWARFPLDADSAATIWVPPGYKMTVADLENLQILLEAHGTVLRRVAQVSTAPPRTSEAP